MVSCQLLAPLVLLVASIKGLLPGPGTILSCYHGSCRKVLICAAKRLGGHSVHANLCVCGERGVSLNAKGFYLVVMYTTHICSFLYILYVLQRPFCLCKYRGYLNLLPKVIRFELSSSGY